MVVIDVEGYLRRLRLLHDGPPSVAGLFSLQRAHVERVAYENLAIWLDQPTTVDPAESAGRIVAGRGGYCFHLNGAFSALLNALGYQVTRHFGSVQGSPASPAGSIGNHLVLTVTGLPTPDNPTGEWLVDAGLGDAIHDPIPLIPGTYHQGPFVYGLRPSEAEPGGWRLDHDPRGSFHGMDLRPGPVTMDTFENMHKHLSTSPDSSFVRTSAIQRRDPNGIDTLTGLSLRRLGHHDTTTLLDRETDFSEALADIFGLTITRQELTHLWPRLWTAHEKWLTTKTS
ncbi:arylamine N-acetyltransferase [Acrocarpospora corrugata]|uniref:Arylamine N-acetyltransferase n=1 Tax=Acrocarpospora corrugata TaxID=35763 RepID=A0A5M3W5T3_9ACTN|nr:arylamine N-acetyltransferase [Acrocarpospora corrugata]